MKYVLLICDNEVDPPSHEELAADPVHDEFQATLNRRGTSLGGARPVSYTHLTLPTILRV